MDRKITVVLSVKEACVVSTVLESGAEMLEDLMNTNQGFEEMRAEIAENRDIARDLAKRIHDTYMGE